MNRTAKIALTFILPVLAVLFLLGTQYVLAGSSLDAQATLCVKPSGNGCHATIGNALDAANEGDLIRVAAGTYTENVVVSKTVTLEGGWNLDLDVRDPAVYSSTIRPADATQSVVSIEDADPTLDGFVITGGRAEQGGNHGGGLRLIDSEARVYSNTIIGNSAFLLGGGVWVQRGAPTLENNRIEDNWSLGPGQNAYGGGVALESGAATLMNNVIAGNVVSGTTTYGGGVAVVGDEPTVLLQENSVLSNRALAVEMGVGGGVGISDNGTFTLTANLIDGNRITTTAGAIGVNIHAGGGGVGMRDSGSLKLADNVIRTNTISATAESGFDNLAYGGGVYVSGSSLLSMSGDRIEKNRALDSNDDSSLGGGIYQQDGQTMLTNIVVRDNEAMAGGGILVTNDLEIISSTVAGNRASLGGGVYLYYPNSNGSGVVHSSVVSNNHSTRGGGVFQYAGSLAVEDSTILSNVVEEGGGIFSEYARNTDALTVTRSTIGANQAMQGAGIYTEIDLRMETTVVSANVASDVGGGLVTRRAATVVDSAIVDNGADSYGAALSHVSSDAMTLQNVTISGNDAGSAGAVYFDGDADLTNVTLTGNGPAGIFRQSGKVRLINTIITGSQEANCSEALTSLGHNLEDGNTCGLDPGMDDLIFVDPLLRPLADNGGPTPTHALVTDSQAIDAGDGGVCPAADQRGVVRPLDGDHDDTPVCDIGAYEYDLVQAVYLPAVLK